MDYNAAQKRKDRRKENYLKEIENSGNKEKTFYENIVQIGKKEDTPVVDADGNLTEEAKIYFAQCMDWVRVTGNSKILILQKMIIL